MNFGISQKMLNLYLKYQWCLGNIKEPPHFPVDRIIQEKLNQVAKNNNLPKIVIEAWTLFENETKYLHIIRFAEQVKNTATSLKQFSLPELELHLFDRR